MTKQSKYKNDILQSHCFICSDCFFLAPDLNSDLIWCETGKEDDRDPTETAGKPTHIKKY